MSSNSPTRGKHENNDGTYDSSADDEDALFDEVVCSVAFGESKPDDKKSSNLASAKALPESRADVEPKVEWKTDTEKELPAKMEEHEQEEWGMTENPHDPTQTLNWDEEEYDTKEEEEISSHTCRTTEEKHASARKRMREESLEKRYERVSRNRRNSGSSSSTTSSGISAKRPDFEGDPAVLARRQKDIEYGKNTIGYDRYIKMVPKDQRTREHPRTPPKYVKYSRRGWDGMVKLWRKQLHQWDPPEENGDKKDVVDPSSA